MGSTLDLVAYADGDYASKASGRRSVSVGAVMCAGACVYCFLRAQKCGTLSTTEAEYVTLVDTIKDAMFVTMDLPSRMRFFFDKCGVSFSRGLVRRASRC